jgi:hypothetical protein
MADASSSARAEELASRFVAANEAFIAYIETLTPSQWLMFVADEERTIAALAHHVAWAMVFEVEAFQIIAGGADPTPVTLEQLSDVNAINGAEYAEVPREKAVAVLRQNGASAAAFVGGLSDEQLARKGRYLDYIPAMSIENWVRRVLINHIEMHWRSIRAALGHTQGT